MDVLMRSFRALRMGLAASLIGAIAACAHMPISSIYRLMQFDAAIADPAAIRVATRSPSFLAPQPNGAKLTLQIWREGDSAKATKVFVLEEATEPKERAQLTQFGRSGFAIHTFRLSPEDATAMRALQRELNEATQGRHKGHASIGASMDACRIGSLPKGPILSSTYMKLNAAEGYLPVLVDVDLRKEAGEARLAQTIPQCAVR
jgi:hypothetical protein